MWAILASLMQSQSDPSHTFDSAPFREEELGAVAPILSWSFGSALGDMEPWLRKAGLDNVRVVRRRGAIEACLVVIPMGQFFGGKSVPMFGVAGVASSVEARGTGASIELMQRTLRELHARVVALSTLYPATLSLYRKVGYESAGGQYEARVPVGAIDVRDRRLPLRAMTPDDDAAIEACYRARATRANGFLDRGPYMWARTRNPRNVAVTRGFVVGEAGHVEGYALLNERVDAALHYALHASDLVATTPRAHRRLLALAADHGTLGTHFVWRGAPCDPFVQLLPRNGCEVRLVDPWMLRIVHFASAMTARGWPSHVALELDFDVTDDVIAENAGRWSVRIAEGRGEVVRGGKGAIRIDVRALASLYSGWLDPFALAATGGIDAPEGELEKVAVAFAGGAPWMPDGF